MGVAASDSTKALGLSRSDFSARQRETEFIGQLLLLILNGW